MALTVEITSPRILCLVGGTTNFCTIKTYWKLRREKIADLKENLPENVTFEQSVVRQLSLGIFTLAVVNAAHLRKYFDPQFEQGGHHKIYPEYVPVRTFIAEKALDWREIPVTFMHEIVEYFLMSPKRIYQASHAIADKLERKVRRLFFGASYPTV